MRITTIAAVLAFASLGVGAASAAGPRADDKSFAADFGVGGLAFDAHVRPPASGAIAVAPNAHSEIEYHAATPGGFADRERLWLWLELGFGLRLRRPADLGRPWPNVGLQVGFEVAARSGSLERRPKPGVGWQSLTVGDRSR